MVEKPWLRLMWAAAALGVLCGCGSSAADRAAVATTSTSTTTEPSDQEVLRDYAEAVQVAWTETFLPYDAETGDVRANVATLIASMQRLTAPPGRELQHDRMLATHQTYLALHIESDASCPGPDCVASGGRANDARMAAIESIYEATGLTYGTLFADVNAAS